MVCGDKIIYDYVDNHGDGGGDNDVDITKIITN
jgi:hypothetical protein